MNIPEGYTEQEVIDIIDKIAKAVCYRFRFMSYTEEDIYQEAFCEGIKGLDRYNGAHPLENFLRVHITNRMKNFKRDKYMRLESKESTREAKLKILNPAPITDVANENSILDNIDVSEQIGRIIENLQPELRMDFFRFLNNVKLNKISKDKLYAACREILSGSTEEA